MLGRFEEQDISSQLRELEKDKKMQSFEDKVLATIGIMNIKGYRASIGNIAQAVESGFPELRGRLASEQLNVQEFLPDILGHLGAMGFVESRRPKIIFRRLKPRYKLTDFLNLPAPAKA